eukprot:3507978-Amphidinium_carterae.1
MQQHLKGLDAYPLCQIQSVCFGHDGKDDGTAIDYTVMFAKLAPAMIEEVETLLSNEVVPKGQRWNNVPSVLMEAYTRQEAGISRFTKPKKHLLPTLHRLAEQRPSARTSKESR